MRNLSVTLGILFLGVGSLIGQTSVQKQREMEQKQVKPTFETMKEVRYSTRSGRLFVPDMVENKSLDWQVLKEGAVALSTKPETKAGAVLPPYICAFDYKKVLEEEWIVTDQDGDGKSWVYATSENYPTFDGNDESGFLAVGYNETTPSANYLITKAPIRMAAGSAYVAFHHASRGGNYKERIRVYYSEEGNDDVSKMTLIGELEDSTLVWKFSVMPFEVKAAGDYYFCFLHCSDADQYNMYLDNVEIGEGVFVGKPDLKVEQVMLPFSACGLGTAEKVGVLVTNVGTASVTEMELSYAVNEGTPVVEKNGTLAPCETRMFYFGQTADFSEEGIAYAVSVSVTVLESDGEREEQLGNNTKIGSVTHFLPFESFPFVVNTELEADLEQLGYDPLIWVYDEEYGELHAMDTMPLMTRCMVLEADQKYRFTLDYLAGMAYWGLFAMPEDFEVVYGQAGTPVATWEVLKSYKNVYTNEALAYDEIWFTNKATGNYSFAIVPKISQYGSYNGSLYVAGIGVEKVAAHDVKMAGYLPSIGAKTPAVHAVAPRFEVAVANRGSNDEDEVKVKVSNGETEVGLSQGQTVKSGDTAYYVFTGRMAEPAVGDEVTLTFEAVMPSEDAEKENNTGEWSFTATDELYAFDEALPGYYDGIGTQKFIFGQIFTLAVTDTLTAMQFGWYDLSKVYNQGFPVGLEIYPLDEAGKTGNSLLVYEFVRLLEGGVQEVEIPARVLPAGRYFVALRQLSDNNIALGFDDNPAGVFYALLNGRLEPMGGYGYIAMRAVFGKAAKVVERDMALLAMEKPRAKGVFAANEPVEVTYRNNGLEVMEVEFKCTVDGKALATQKVTVPGYGMGVVVFAADLSAVGKHDILVEVSAEGDEAQDNNTLKATVECLNMDPYVMDFELSEDFAIENLLPWKTVDKDGGDTYGFRSTEWPNIHQPQAFIAFNPEVAGLDKLLSTHNGERMGCVFASVDMQNDDWLISPKLRLPDDKAEVRFFVKSLKISDQESYTEEYNVLVSTTTDDLASFLTVCPTRQAPEEWTESVVDLAAYKGQEVYVAIQCVSDDQFVFMIDDIRVSNPLGLTQKEDLSAYVKSYPNPVADQWTVTAYGLNIEFVEIGNMMGETVYRSSKNLKTETHRVNVSGFTPGLYVARVHTNSGIQVVKIMVR